MTVVGHLLVLLAVMGSSTPPEPVPAAATHVVQAGDSLWAIARRHGCEIADLTGDNDIAAEDVLTVGMRLDMTRCLRNSSKFDRGILHVVQRGDTLAAVAAARGTTVEVLRALNGLQDTMLRPGQTLLLPPPRVAAISVRAGQSLGKPHRGRLRRPVRLRPGRGYHLRRPDRTFAAHHVVEYTTRVLAWVRSKHPDLHAIAIGDLSQAGGGWLSGHRSHQSGRDVDIGLCFREVPRQYPEQFVAFAKGTLDLAATWNLVSAFAATTGLPGGVERIFLDYEVQEELYHYARQRGLTETQLHGLFQVPDGRYAKHGVVRHVPRHDDHLHVRFRCPRGDEGCR